MKNSSFESSQKRYSSSKLPVFCYKIKSGVVSDKIVTVTPNWHNEMEIICPEAPLTLYIGSNRYEVQPWEVLFINPREMHRAYRKADGPIRSVVFDLDVLKTQDENDRYNILIDEIVKGKKKFITRVDNDTDLYREMRVFFDTVDKYAYSRFESGKERYRMLSSLYAMMAACVEADAFEDSPMERQHGINCVNGIVAYINEHHDEPLTATRLAGEFNISEPYLYSLFNKYVGITPLQYINSTRLSASYRLLGEGKSVTEVALAVGFLDVSYFIKFFKNATGQTPLKWRTQNSKGAPVENNS